ncbi:hypothetical protein DPEC_G00095770 [Dallia pectoralis]|uniref:Uncharacterized protein n=1 Tax=Dallia pectoralis TaxID=75939 RepID=A0ACC2GVC5_DALPE|nr:hypothetical protein DPEC_G00095770 [Dallia pectoralis]
MFYLWARGHHYRQSDRRCYWRGWRNHLHRGAYLSSLHSLIVTWVGVGVAVAGGATAEVSNITNIVNQSTDRQAIKNIIKEFQEKMNSVVTSIQDIAEGLETLRSRVTIDTGRDYSTAEYQ